MSHRLGARTRQCAADSSDRARALEEIIDDLGSSPYRGTGLARPIGTAAGWLLAAFSKRAALAVSRRISAHAMAEYVALAALADGAPGVPEALIDRIAPLLADATSEAACFLEQRETQGLSGGESTGENSPDP